MRKAATQKAQQANHYYTIRFTTKGYQVVHAQAPAYAIANFEQPYSDSKAATDAFTAHYPKAQSLSNADFNTTITKLATAYQKDMSKLEAWTKMTRK